MRRIREASPVDIYHVSSRGTARQMIFEDDGDREYLLSLIVRFKKELNVELYAWCFMSNHIHLLIHAPLDRTAQFMKSLLGTYARAFNTRRERAGHVFHERYMSEPIDTDEYLLTVIRYIHQNPEAAHIAATSAYRWSSYAEYAGIQRGTRVQPICETKFPLELFGGRDAFVRFHQTPGVAEEHEDGAPDLPCGPNPDERALAVATEVLDMEPNRLKTLDKPTRDVQLRKLREAGISIRTIERLTGIGRGVICRISTEA